MTTVTDRIELSSADKLSPAWATICTYLDRRLTTLRARNDNDLSPDETARLRGSISEVRALRALGDDRPIF